MICGLQFPTVTKRRWRHLPFMKEIGTASMHCPVSVDVDLILSREIEARWSFKRTVYQVFVLCSGIIPSVSPLFPENVFDSSWPVVQKGFLDLSRGEEYWSMSLWRGTLGEFSIFLYSLRVASFLLKSDGGMLDNTGSQSRGVDLRLPVIIRIVVLSWVSISLVWELFSQTGQQYSAAE